MASGGSRSKEQPSLPASLLPSLSPATCHPSAPALQGATYGVKRTAPLRRWGKHSGGASSPDPEAPGAKSVFIPPTLPPLETGALCGGVLSRVETGHVLVSHSQAAGTRGATRATSRQSSYFHAPPPTRGARPSGRWKPARGAGQLRVVRPRRAPPGAPRSAGPGLPPRARARPAALASSGRFPELPWDQGSPGRALSLPGEDLRGRQDARGAKAGKEALGRRSQVRLRAERAGRAAPLAAAQVERAGGGGEASAQAARRLLSAKPARGGAARTCFLQSCLPRQLLGSRRAARRAWALQNLHMCVCVEDANAAEFECPDPVRASVEFVSRERLPAAETRGPARFSTAPAAFHVYDYF